MKRAATGFRKTYRDLTALVLLVLASYWLLAELKLFLFLPLFGG